MLSRTYHEFTNCECLQNISTTHGSATVSFHGAMKPLRNAQITRDIINECVISCPVGLAIGDLFRANSTRQRHKWVVVPSSNVDYFHLPFFSAKASKHSVHFHTKDIATCLHRQGFIFSVAHIYFHLTVP